MRGGKERGRERGGGKRQGKERERVEKGEGTEMIWNEIDKKKGRREKRGRGTEGNGRG